LNSETGASEWEHDENGELVSVESELEAKRAAAAAADAAAEVRELDIDTSVGLCF